MCWIYSVICWSNTKRFLSILIVFLESVFILKNVKIFKNCATLFRQLILTGHSNRETLVASLLRSSCDSLVSQAPCCEKDLEKFQNFLVLAFFCDSVWRLVRKWKLQLQVYSECFATPFVTYSQLDLPITKNTWTNFSKFVEWDFGDLTWWHVRNSF